MGSDPVNSELPQPPCTGLISVNISILENGTSICVEWSLAMAGEWGDYIALWALINNLVIPEAVDKVSRL